METVQLQPEAERAESRPPEDGETRGPIGLHLVLQDEIQKRRQADEALRLAEHRYRSIFEHALEGIFQTSADGRYIAANPALMKMYGYDSFEELAAAVDNIATKLYVDPQRRSEFVRIMREKGQVLHFESEVRRRDGRTLWISENVRSIADEEGNFLYYEGTVDDITELKLAREKIGRTQVRLEKELSEAADYVRTLLPEPLAGPIEARWCYLPSSHLGGDGFGYHWLDEDSLAVYLLDVSGHGVGSALLCISVLNVLRLGLLAVADFRDPGAVLEALNRSFPMAQNNDKYFTIWYGVYHRGRREFAYASAGHHAALLFAEGGNASRMLSGGPAIGTWPDVTFASARCAVPAGADFYLFSDGVYEIARPEGSWLTFDDFAQFLQESRPPVEATVERMRELHGPPEFEDDFSLIRMSFK
jgi:PAS domain S-box-containing protein